MQHVHTFFAMGGYAPFIWPAFGLTAVVLVGLAILSRRSLKHREATLASLQRQPRRGGPDRGTQA
jgi:heme exporter protein CcmD